MNKKSLVLALVLVSAVAASAAYYGLYEDITSFNVPAYVPKGAVGVAYFTVNYNNSVNGSNNTLANGSNTTFYEYPAVYGKNTLVNGSLLNGTNNNWAVLCVFPAEYVNYAFSKTYSCSVPADYRPGTYVVRATVHTPDRAGCKNVEYTPEPYDGCGDYMDRYVEIIR